jgi:hypothetical protein
MTRAGRSLFVFGFYPILAGIFLIVAPNVLFRLSGVAASTEIWPRFAGVLSIVIGFYEMQAGRKSIVDFLWWSIYARASLVIFLSAFVVLGLAQPTLIILGVIDLAGSAWTWIALQRSKHSKDKS